MTIPIATASPWPARCAYFSAAIFIAAAGATNIVYGWSKGDTSQPRSCGLVSREPSPSSSPLLAGTDPKRRRQALVCCADLTRGHAAVWRLQRDGCARLSIRRPGQCHGDRDGHHGRPH